MLRAKQVSALSNGARTFFISGSRCNAADESACTCSEDETCITKTQYTKKENFQAHKQTALASTTSDKVGTLVLGNSVNVLRPGDTESVDQPSSIKQALSVATSPSQCDTGKHDRVINNADNMVSHISPLNSDQFLRAGIAAVNFLSDMVNYKLPISVGNGASHYSSNYMVDPTRPVPNVRSSNVKHIKRENFFGIHPESSVQDASGRNCVSNYPGAKGKVDKLNSTKSLKYVPSSGMDRSVATPVTGTPCSSPVTVEREVPKGSRVHPNKFISKAGSNMHNSSLEVVGSVNMGFNKHPSDLKSSSGIGPSGRSFTNMGRIVEVVSGILKRQNWGPAAERSLDSLNCSLDAYQANQILKQIHDCSVALGFFYWLKRQPGFKHDGHTYTTMVGILGRARQFGTINKLMEQMAVDGCRPNVVTFNRLIHSYGRANYLKEALNVFNQMQRVGCEPDRVTYCTLIDIHAKAGFLDVAISMYDRMQEVGLSPDTFTYSVMINCLGKSGNLAAAHRLFCEMVDQGCVPNLVTYNIMIALQAKARNYDTALNLYRDMQNAGFEPDKVTYNIVMEVLGHCGYLEEAEAVFVEMKRRSWVPDEPVYGLLVDLWGKSGNVEKAWEWYQAMRNAGLKPNVPICNSLLSAFLRVHRLSDAYVLLQSMVALGLGPTLQTYTLLLSCCTDAQSPYDMGFCCELMATSGHPAHAFLLSMPAAGPDGQNVRDHASRFFDLIHTEDRESKRGLVDAVVDFLHKSGLKEEAGSVWEVAAQKNVYPDAVKEKSSCYWVVNLHVMSDGTAVTALSKTLAWFRRQMLKSGIGPSRIDIVTGWGRRSRVTGTSMVRQAVRELLHMFSFPFFTENGNCGCLVACGEPLNRWLLQSYVERMHLL